MTKGQFRGARVSQLTCDYRLGDPVVLRLYDLLHEIRPTLIKKVQESSAVRHDLIERPVVPSITFAE